MTFLITTIKYVLLFNGLMWITIGNKMPTRCFGSRRMSCSPIIPSFVQFYGWNLSNIEELYLHKGFGLHWTLKTLPVGLFNWANKIDYLSMNDVGLEDLNCDIFQPLKNSLYSINMNQNLFQEFPSCSLKNLNQLKHMVFAYQDIQSVNINDLELNSLSHLDLSRNKISNFSISNINNNNNIQIILDVNKISYLNISGVNRIQNLYAEKNQLTEINHGIFHNSYSTLSVLELSYNALDDDIWNVLEGTTSLGKLNLRQNRLQTVRPSVIAHLSKLYQLDLSFNYISSLTDVLIMSGKISRILFNSNKLVDVPTYLIDNTINFEDSDHCTLDISNNMMDLFQFSIPKTLKSLTLNLGQNQLTAIHFEQNYNAIKSLNISSNLLTSLPEKLPIANSYIISNNPLNTTNVLKHLKTTMKEATHIEMDNINFLCNRSEHYDFTNLQFSKISTLSLRDNCIPLSFLCYIGNRTISVYLDNNKNHNNSIDDLLCEIQTKRFDVVSFSGRQMTEVLFDLFMSKNIKTIENVTSMYCKKCQLREFPFIRYVSSKSLNNVFDFSENFLNVFNGLEIRTSSFDLTLNLEHNQISNFNKVTVKQTKVNVYCNFRLKFMNNSISKVNHNRTLIELIGMLNCKYVYISIDLSFNRIDELDLATIISNIENPYLTVQNLNVSHNNLEEYRNCLQNVWQFQILDLTYNRLRNVPDSSCRYASETYLGHNTITNISRTFPQANINNLDLEWNLIQYINDGAFTNMTSLRTLNLRGNKLKNFPKAVQKLRYLTKLDISYNKITTIKQSDFGGIMNYLTSLILTGNDLIINPHTSISLFGPFQDLDLTDNLLYCDCDVSFLRNHTNTYGRCSFPPEFEGYLVSCFPVHHCIKNFPIYVYRETKTMCLYDDYFDIKISILEDDEILSVGWKRLGQNKQTGIQLIAYREHAIVKQILVKETSQTNTFFLPHSLDTDRVCIHALLKDRTIERCVDVNHSRITSMDKIKSVSETNSNNGPVYGTSAALALSVLLNVLGSILIFVFIRRKKPTKDDNSNQIDKNAYVPSQYEMSSDRRGACDQQLDVYDQLSENSNNTGEGAYENLNICNVIS